jgi:hypothetical protein
MLCSVKRAAKRKTTERPELALPVRLSVRLDADVVELGNQALKRVKWKSVSHMVNATLRRTLQSFALPGQEIVSDPFAQLVFDAAEMRRAKK